MGTRLTKASSNAEPVLLDGKGLCSTNLGMMKGAPRTGSPYYTDGRITGDFSAKSNIPLSPAGKYDLLNGTYTNSLFECAQLHVETAKKYMTQYKDASGSVVATAGGVNKPTNPDRLLSRIGWEKIMREMVNAGAGQWKFNWVFSKNTYKDDLGENKNCFTTGCTGTSGSHIVENQNYAEMITGEVDMTRPIETFALSICTTPMKGLPCQFNKATKRIPDTCTPLTARNDSPEGKYCQEWFDALPTDVGTVTRKRVVTEICNTFPGLDECACIKRYDNELFRKIIDTKTFTTISDICWYLPCKEIGADRLMIPSEEQARTTCAGTFCANFVSVVGSTDINIDAAKQVVNCTQSEWDKANTGGGEGDPSAGGDGGGSGTVNSQTLFIVLALVSIVAFVIIVIFLVIQLRGKEDNKKKKKKG